MAGHSSTVEIPELKNMRNLKAGLETLTIPQSFSTKVKRSFQEKKDQLLDSLETKIQSYGELNEYVNENYEMLRPYFRLLKMAEGHFDTGVRTDVLVDEIRTFHKLCKKRSQMASQSHRPSRPTLVASRLGGRNKSQAKAKTKSTSAAQRKLADSTPAIINPAISGPSGSTVLEVGTSHSVPGPSTHRRESGPSLTLGPSNVNYTNWDMADFSEFAVSPGLDPDLILLSNHIHGGNLDTNLENSQETQTRGTTNVGPI